MHLAPYLLYPQNRDVSVWKHGQILHVTACDLHGCKHFVNKYKKVDNDRLFILHIETVDLSLEGF